MPTSPRPGPARVPAGDRQAAAVSAPSSPPSSTTDTSTASGSKRSRTTTCEPRRVGGRVAQRLLHDAVQREPHRRWQPALLTLDGEVDRQARVAGAVEQSVRSSTPRQGIRHASVAVDLPQDAEHAAHLGQRLACAALDRRQGFPRPRRVVVQDACGGHRLEDDDVDVVGHRVVQLTGDPCPLICYRRPGLVRPSLLQRDVLLGEAIRPADAAHPAPDQRRHEEQQVPERRRPCRLRHPLARRPGRRGRARRATATATPRPATSCRREP